MLKAVKDLLKQLEPYRIKAEMKKIEKFEKEQTKAIHEYLEQEKQAKEITIPESENEDYDKADYLAYTYPELVKDEE